MITIVAGSRRIMELDSPQLMVGNAIKQAPWQPSEIVSGCAKGVDQLGEIHANRNDIPVKRFPANWSEHGASAGPIRNEEMAEYAEALIAVRVDESAGTTNMIQNARERYPTENIHVIEIDS